MKFRSFAVGVEWKRSSFSSKSDEQLVGHGLCFRLRLGRLVVIDGLEEGAGRLPDAQEVDERWVEGLACCSEGVVRVDVEEGI